MSYYDNIKDNVKKQASQKNSGSGSSGKGNSGGGNFDTLREAAEETSEEEEHSDDTPIEVLEEDGLSRESPGKKQRQQNSGNHGKDSSAGSSGSSGNGNPLTSGSNQSSASGQDMSGVEEKLDRIIDQNQEMIEILRSFTE